MSPEFKSIMEELLTAAEELFLATSPYCDQLSVLKARGRYQKAREAMNKFSLEIG